MGGGGEGVKGVEDIQFPWRRGGGGGGDGGGVNGVESMHVQGVARRLVNNNVSMHARAHTRTHTHTHTHRLQLPIFFDWDFLVSVMKI